MASGGCQHLSWGTNDWGRWPGQTGSDGDKIVGVKNHSYPTSRVRLDLTGEIHIVILQTGMSCDRNRDSIPVFRRVIKHYLCK